MTPGPCNRIRFVTSSELPADARGRDFGLWEQLESLVEQVVLGRWDGYWRAPAKLKQLVFKVVEDFSARVSDLVR